MTNRANIVRNRVNRISTAAAVGAAAALAAVVVMLSFTDTASATATSSPAQASQDFVEATPASPQALVVASDDGADRDELLDEASAVAEMLYLAASAEVAAHQAATARRTTARATAKSDGLTRAQRRARRKARAAVANMDLTVFGTNG